VRGLPFAGSGVNLAAASAPGYQGTPRGRVALVAAAAGMIRPGGAATEDRAGVHELRAAPGGGLERDDVERMLASIRTAAAEADVVLAYLHNHLWEADITRTPEWQREFARRCIDAGAAAFCAHGTPLLQGIEMYRGAPLFHGLGSFIFQTRKADDAYGDANWESVIAECRFEGRRFVAADLVPVQLARIGAAGPTDLATRGRPSPASRSAARATLARLAALSARLDYRLQIEGTRGLIEPR
jgi:poly-gamma-glutamate synthesis protein (capsule biosynthesis protein)